MLEPSSECVAIRTNDGSKKIKLDGGTGQTVEVEVKTDLWADKRCEVTVQPIVEGMEPLTLPKWTIPITIEPSFVAIVVIVTVGTLVAYFILSAVQWVSLQEARQQDGSGEAGKPAANWKTVWIGNGWTKVISIAVRAMIAVMLQTCSLQTSWASEQTLRASGATLPWDSYLAYGPSTYFFSG